MGGAICGDGSEAQFLLSCKSDASTNKILHMKFKLIL